MNIIGRYDDIADIENEGIFHSSLSEDDQIYEESIDQDSEDYITIKMLKQYIQKMENDIAQLHKRHKDMIKEVEEDFQKDNFNEFLEWKNSAKSRMKMYKKVIKELILQLEQLEKDKSQIISELKDEISKRKYEIESISAQYESDQTKWDNDKDTYENIIDEQQVKIHNLKENEKKLISYEGQIEDLNMHIISIKRDYENLIRKHHKEIEKIEKRHLDLEVKGCVENMLVILELQEKNKRNQNTIKMLKAENIRQK